MPAHVGLEGPPAIPLRFVTAQVAQSGINFLLGIIGGHLVHEIQELETTVVMACLDLPGGYIQSRKQGRGAMALVFVVEALEGLPVGKPQVSLRGLFQDGRFPLEVSPQCILPMGE